MKRFYLTHVFAKKQANGTIIKYYRNFTETYSTMKGVQACVSRMNKTNVEGEEVYLGAYVRDRRGEVEITTMNGKLGYFHEEHGFLVVCGL